MYRLAVKYFAGGEVRVTTSLFSVMSPAGDKLNEGSDPLPPPPSPPLLDYSSELETKRSARLSGHGELAIRTTKFGNEAKRQIQRAARALDGIVETPQDILFLTGTLPGSGQEQFLAIAQWSSWIVHRLKAWVAKSVVGKMDFYCWELQKRGALHLHYAVHCPDESGSQYIMENFKKEWLRLLDSVSESTGVDLYLNAVRGFSHKANKEVVQAKAERVTKGVGNYLGKYLSKSTQGTSRRGVFAPCRWWGVSRPLRELEKSERMEQLHIFVGSSQWHALYEECVKWLGIAGDVCHEWKNKYTPGKGAVIYGVTKQTMQTLMEMVGRKPMGTKTPRQQVAAAWAILKDGLVNVEMNQPNWFGSMSRKLVVMRRWETIQSYGYDQIGSPSEIAVLQAIAWNLRDLLMSDERINVEYLKHGWKSILLYGCNCLQDALDEVYKAEYGLSESEDFYTLHLGGE
jgi:hypothetical protein